MPISRNDEQRIIMVVLYDVLSDFVLGNGEVKRDARQLIADASGCAYSEVSPYVKNVVSYSLNHYGDIKDVFVPHLNGWKWDRLPLLTQSILLMSYAHKEVEPVDKKVIINVAVKLAKDYVDEKQAKFINAILDGVL